jgi:hypothetical protein
MRVSEYRTVPYAIFHDEEGRKTDEQVKILDIDQKQG